MIRSPAPPLLLALSLALSPAAALGQGSPGARPASPPLASQVPAQAPGPAATQVEAPAPTAPASTPTGGGGLPIAVDADNAIEWHQEQKAYVARGNAVATRGDMTVSAPVLVAYYRELDGGGTEIFRLAADGGVRIESPTQEVVGERAVYDIDRKVIVVTGGNLRLTTPRDVVTARDSLEYWEEREVAVARGDAVAVRGQNKVRGDVLVGQFDEVRPDVLEMRRMDAQGGVVITTPTDVGRGREGTYDLVTEIATLTGDVRLTRGQNQLNGDAAEVNMRTGVSRMVSLAQAQGASPGQGPGQGAGQPGTRVRGLFVPGQQAGTPRAGAAQPGSPQPGNAQSGGAQPGARP